MDREEGSTKTDNDTNSGIDQAESYANDPANRSTNHVDDLKDKVGAGKNQSASRMNQLAKGAKSFAGSKNGKIGGAGVGIMTLLIASFISLSVLKLDAFMKNIYQKRVGDKVEHMLEKRADKMIIRHLAQSGAQVGTYSNGKLLTSMYRNMTLKNFEGKFSEKSGIKIESIKGGGIRLTSLDGKVQPFNTSADFEKYLAKGDLQGIDARKFIREVTRSETHWIQVYKRANLRKYMKNAYGITKWSWFKGTKGKAGESQLSSSLIDDVFSSYREQTPKVINCATEGKNCLTDQGPRQANYGENPTGVLDTKPVPVEGEKVGDSIKDGLDEAKLEVNKSEPKGLANKALTKVLTRIFSEKIATTFTEGIVPIIGQILLIDMFSRIDNFFISGKADVSVRTVHKLQYVTQFAAFTSMNDNLKDPNKTASGDEVNLIMTKLGDPSTSSGFHQIFLNSDGGTGIDPTLGVDDQGQSPIKTNYDQKTKLSPIYPDLLSLRAWYAAVHASKLDKVIDLLNSVIGWVLGVVLDAIIIPAKLVVNGIDAISGTHIGRYFALVPKAIGSLFMEVLYYAITPAVDGTEKDGALFSGLDVGASVLGQDYTKSLGGHEMNTVATMNNLRAINLEKRQSQPGIFARLFSPDYNTSLVNQLAVVAPTSSGQAVSQLSRYSLSLVKNPASIMSGLGMFVTGKVQADSPRNLYGLKDYGYTEDELDQELQLPEDNNKDGKIDRLDCEYNSDGSIIKDFDNLKTGRICLLDVATVESLGSVFTDENDGGIN